MYYVLKYTVYSLYRHPLTLSILLQSRNYDSICFITDSVCEPNVPPDYWVNYNGRKCKINNYYKVAICSTYYFIFIT